ncbi:MAG TPA: hypothetical protein VEH57_02975 [Thermoplasmata archaeon]|nr:hypothetical protein [Thermoplasmata archaeon]
MASKKTHRLIAAIIILVGAIVLIAALFMPWYSYKISEAGASETTNTYPGLPGSNGTIQYSCSGIPSCPSQTSYSKLNWNNTGALAEAGFYMLIVGFILGLIGAIFGFMARGNPRRVGPAVAFAVLALILAIVAPVLFAASLPNAISKDIPAAARPSSSGPWSSFWGSNSTTLVTPPITISQTWGAGSGWYVSIAAFVILLVGIFLLFIWRRDPPEPVPVAAPAAAPGAAPRP